MPDVTSCWRAAGGYCQRCDILVGLDGIHVVAAEHVSSQLCRVGESAPGQVVAVVWWPTNLG